MKLRADSEIARVKVTNYLLKVRDEDDKSKFLALAGYTLAHADKLLEDLRSLLHQEAELVQATGIRRQIPDSWHIDWAERQAAPRGQHLDDRRGHEPDKVCNSVS